MPIRLPALEAVVAGRDAPSAWFLVGQTATGKTAVAQWIAERHDCVIVSADSMLVYEGMDIGTAKPSSSERGDVPYFGIDLCEPDRDFSLESYLRRVRAAWEDGRDVIVVGGTGLYLRAIVHGLEPTAPPDAALRAEWESRVAQEGVEPLQRALREVNPQLYASLADTRNPRRLIRALERHAAGFVEPATHWRGAEAVPPMIGLRLGADTLKTSIESRVHRMYGAGLIEEVRGLIERFGELSSTAAQAIGYAEAVGCIEGRWTSEEAMRRTVTRTRQLAKRQRTWFARQANVEWIEPASGAGIAGVAAMVFDRWCAHGPIRVAL